MPACMASLRLGLSDVVLHWITSSTQIDTPNRWTNNHSINRTWPFRRGPMPSAPKLLSSFLNTTVQTACSVIMRDNLAADMCFTVHAPHSAEHEKKAGGRPTSLRGHAPTWDRSTSSMRSIADWVQCRWWPELLIVRHQPLAVRSGSTFQLQFRPLLQWTKFQRR